MEKIIPAWYYQQFDADYNLEYPGEGYGGWKKENLPINPDKTAIVLMHAWDTGTIEQYPGWFRAVEYIPRATHICDNLLPDFLKRVRSSDIRLIHIAASNQVVNEYKGYTKTLELCGEDTILCERMEQDETIKKLNIFRGENVFVGTHNKEDVVRGQKRLDFYPTARPLDHEYIVCTSEQLFKLCRRYGINHLIYTGFAINMCLTVSPGGFVDMSRRGIMCSAIKQLVTAVENKESCRTEANKNYGLWYINILSGFVYEMVDIEKYLL